MFNHPLIQPQFIPTTRYEPEPTVADLAERYLTEHAMLHCKPRTVAYYREHLQTCILPVLGHLEVAKVTRRHVFALHNSLQHLPYRANRCLEIISKMFNLAEMWEWRQGGTNPRRHILKFKEKMRERYLSKKETQRLMEVLTDPKLHRLDLSASYLFRLLLLTGCRLGEIVTLKWEYIDDDYNQFNLPDSKTGAKKVSVGKSVMALLHEIRIHPDRPITNPYVIWGKYEDALLADPQKKWRKFRKLAGIEDVRIHDLRHNFASYAVNQGMSLEMIGKLLGHKQVTTTARYAHLGSAEIRRAADLVSGGISVTGQYS